MGANGIDCLWLQERAGQVWGGRGFGPFNPLTQKMTTEDVYVDTLHSSGDFIAVAMPRAREEGSMCWQVPLGRQELNVANTFTFPSISRDWRGVLFRPHLMRLAYDQASSHC